MLTENQLSDNAENNTVISNSAEPNSDCNYTCNMDIETQAIICPNIIQVFGTERLIAKLSSVQHIAKKH